TSDARSTRNASLNRASVKTEPTATMDQNVAENSRNWLHRILTRPPAKDVCGGSPTKRTRNTIERNGGTKDNQKTKGKLPQLTSMRTVARSGPVKAPIVSSV